MRTFLVLTLLLITSIAVAQAPATQPAEEGTITREQRDKLIVKAKQRMAADRKKYSQEQLAEAEQLYQTANKDWRSDAAVTALKTMIEKYPNIDRTGCAVLYMGQMTEGQEREKYLTQAIKDHSDCWYGNGVQVGALARLFLAEYLISEGKQEDAEKWMREIEKDYPNSITHSGKLIVPALSQLRQAKP